MSIYINTNNPLLFACIYYKETAVSLQGVNAIKAVKVSFFFQRMP